VIKKDEMNKALEAMVETPGWQLLKEYILKKINENNKISCISKNGSPDEIARSVFTAQSRVDVYKSVLNWVEEKVKKITKEEENA